MHIFFDIRIVPRSKSSCMASILIPTKNRSEYIIRQLKYYQSVRSTHNILIGDASDEDHYSKTADFIKSIKNINVFHYALPNTSTIDTIIYLCNKSNDKYVCFTGDDDFQITSNFEKLERFLEQNPDYVSAQGRSLIFSIPEKNTSKNHIYSLDEYPTLSCEKNSSTERIESLFNKYSISFFGLSRREIFQAGFASGKGMINKTLTDEILPCSYLSACGKTKLFPFLSFVREGLPETVKYTLPSAIDWILLDNFSSTVNRYLDIIAQLISKTDKIEFDLARKTAKKAFAKYLISALSKQNIKQKNKPKVMKLFSKTKSILRTARNLKYRFKYQNIQPGIGGWINKYPEFIHVYNVLSNNSK